MQISILNKSATVGSFRIDSECYQKRYVSLEKRLLSQRVTFLGQETCKFHKGIFDIKAGNYVKSGTPFVRIGDLKDATIDVSNMVYISEFDHSINRKSALRRGDIVLSKTGYPAAAFVDLNECNTSQDTIAISLKGNSKIGSEYLVTFLNSKYGLPQMERWFTGNVQMHLNLSDTKKIIVPVFTPRFQNVVKTLFSEVIDLKNRSGRKYEQAESLLLSELGLADWHPKHKLSFRKRYSDTQRVSRIDAEYFQPKYEEIVHAIKNCPSGWDVLGRMVNIQKCIEVGSDNYLNEGIPFVRVSNLSPYGISKGEYISESHYNGVKEHQPKPGEILFSKDGTPGIAYHFRHDVPKMIPSGGILRIQRKTDKIGPDYLTLVLNSLLTKEQINRDV